jgi:hypothetical protein
MPGRATTLTLDRARPGPTCSPLPCDVVRVSRLVMEFKSKAQLPTVSEGAREGDVDDTMRRAGVPPL